MGGTSGWPQAHGRNFLLASGSWEGLPAGPRLVGGTSGWLHALGRKRREMQGGLPLCFQHVQGVHGQKPAPHSHRVCSGGRGLQSGRGGGQDTVPGGLSGWGHGVPFWSRSPVRRDRGPRDWLPFSRFGGSSGASDNGAAAVALRAAFLLFLGVENGEDRFVENGFETLLRQGRALQVALCSDRFG